MYCQKCGAPNPDNAKFCPKCGAALQGNAEAAPAPPRAQEDTRPQNVQTQAQQYAEGKNNAALIGLVLGIISIIVVWFVVWVALATSIVGLVLGSKKRTGPGAGTLGRVLNTIALVIVAIEFVVGVVAGAMLVSSIF